MALGVYVGFLEINRYISLLTRLSGHCYYTPEGNRCRLLPLEEKTENYEHYILSEDDRQDPSIKDKKQVGAIPHPRLLKARDSYEVLMLTWFTQKLWYDILNKQIRGE